MIPINERLIISLFDYTGNWAQPYVKAGYPVMLFDKKIAEDRMEKELGMFNQINKTA